MPFPLGDADVPVTSVPMRLPWTSQAEEALISIPAVRIAGDEVAIPAGRAADLNVADGIRRAQVIHAIAVSRRRASARERDDTDRVADDRGRPGQVAGIVEIDPVRVSRDDVSGAGPGRGSRAADRVPPGFDEDSRGVSQRDLAGLVRPDQVSFDEIADRARVKEPDPSPAFVAGNEVSRAGRRAPDRFV